MVDSKEIKWAQKEMEKMYRKANTLRSKANLPLILTNGRGKAIETIDMDTGKISKIRRS